MMKKTVKTPRRLLALLLCACLGMTALPLTAMAEGGYGGSGTSEETPLEIGTAAALYEFASMVNDGSVYEKLDVPKDTYLYVRLTADLNLHAYAGGEGWNPIGSVRGYGSVAKNDGFKGSFDGGGHTVSGLASSQSYGVLGLFGVVLPDSVVKRVALTDITVKRTLAMAADKLTVGGIAGVNEGTIEDCSISGTVTGTENAGLVAGNNQGTITRCVTAGDVSGEAAGGIAGQNSGGTITDSAALARSVTGTKNGRITPEEDGTVTGCVSWDGAGAGDVYDTGKGLDLLKTAAAWPQGLRAAPWHYTEGGVPSLAETGTDLPAYIGGLSGVGTEKNPYRIGSWDDFLQFAESVKKGNSYQGKVVALSVNITMPAGSNWEPIEGFGGTFDGKQHRIIGLTIDRPEQSAVGLFGRLNKDAPATLRGVILIECEVKGYATSGALVGEAHNATIENCYVSGSVTTVHKDAGGLAGAAFDTAITGCMSAATVQSLWGAAGIVSYMEGGRVADCYTTGTVHTTHASSLGGVVAHVETADAVVERCYTTATLTADGAPRPGMHEGVGGVVGVTTGVQRDLMAINERITAPGAGNVGRTAGKSVGSPDFYNVRSWVMMPVNGVAVADSQSQGYSAAQLKTRDAWAAFQGGAWSYTENGLPTLKNIPDYLQSAGSPPYLQDNYEQQYEEPALDGDGKTYRITQPKQLAWLSLNGTKELLSGKTLSIEANLSLADYQTGAGWTPIGNESNKRIENLTVRGNDNTISDLYMRMEGEIPAYLGLFGTLVRPVISNLSLTKVDIRIKGNRSDVNIGSLCGEILGGIVSGCTVDGKMDLAAEASGWSAGGLIGAVIQNTSGDDIENADPSIAIPVIERCSNNADLSGIDVWSFGGLAGYVYSGLMRECFNTGSVATTARTDTLQANIAGGLVGYWNVMLKAFYSATGYGTSFTVLTNSYNTGTITGTSAGGIIGNLLYSDGTDFNNYSYSVTFNHLYNTGSVYSISNKNEGTAGLIGKVTISKATAGAKRHSLSIDGYALNQSVTVSNADDSANSLVGSIHGRDNAESFAITGGYWDGMTFSGGLPVLRQGTSTSAESIKLIMQMSTYWPTAQWKLESGRLPILKNTPGMQTGYFPLHLALSGNPADENNWIGVYINSAEELRYAAEHYPAGNQYYRFYLGADIDMAGITDFTPFQNFAGWFRGDGHTIQNLVIDRPNQSYVGLFSSVGPTGEVENLSMVDCTVRGDTLVGTIVGECYGTIQSCAVTRSTQAEIDEPDGWQVTGHQNVGGIAGQLWGTRASIRDCYAAVNVRAENGGASGKIGDNVGGIVGEMYSTGSSGNALVRDAFAAGRVVAAGKNAGGVVGYPHGSVTISGANALGDLVASGEPGTAGHIVGDYRFSADSWNGFYAWEETLLTGTPAEDGKGKVKLFTADELADPYAWRAFENATWEKSAGATPTLKDLAGEQNNYLPLTENSLHLRQENGVYLIGSARDLLVMGKLVDTGLAVFQQASYLMDADISLRDLLSDGRTAWTPIGPFAGTFDGDGHTLSGFAPLLTEDRNAAGLFGAIEPGGTVKNLTIQGELTGTLARNANAGLAAASVKGTLLNVTVEGSLSVGTADAVGGLAGLVSGGTVKDCTNRADIQTGSQHYPGVATGGIAGKAAARGTITGCVNTGNLTDVSIYQVRARPMGGVVGILDGASVSLCRSAGGVTASFAGGIAGQTGDSSTVERCASFGPVYGPLSDSVAGGIVGNHAGEVADCYAAGTVGVNNEGENYAGGIAGSMTGGGIRRCYATGAVSGNYASGGIVGYMEGAAQAGATPTIENVAALNAALDGLFYNCIGTMADGGKKPWGGNRYGWDGLMASFSKNPIGLTGFVGKERTWEPAFWSGEANFDLDTVWEIPADSQSGAVFLPILRGMSGQNGSLPLHLQGYIRDETTVSLTLSADNSTLPYTGGERTARITADIAVNGAVSALAIAWSHDGGDEVTVNRVSNTAYDLTFPADFGGDVTVTAAMKDNPAVNAAVKLTVVPPVNAQPPVIGTQPQDADTVVGEPVTLHVEATSPDGGALSYQWYEAGLPDADGTVISGATGDSYEVPAAQPGSLYYYCEVTNTIQKTELVGAETASARSNTARVTVNKASQPPFAIEDGNLIKTYGDADFTLRTSGGGTGAVSWKSSAPDAVSVDGAGKITILKATDTPVAITATKAGDHEYGPVSATVTVTVEKAKLQIKADPQTRVYGEENPAFTYGIEGFVNSDGKADLDELPVLTADADKTTGVGSYAIRLAGGVDDNYAYILNNVVLTITPRPITIKADDKEMNEGGAVPELTWTVTEGSLVDGDDLGGSLKAEATGAGKHPITQDIPLANPNYAVTFLPGELTVLAKREDPSGPTPNEPTHPDVPQTGDGFPSWTLLLLLLSMGGIVLTFRSLRHRKER